MIEEQRKHDRGYQKRYHNCAVVYADCEQQNQTNNQNYELGSDNVRHYRADEKSCFALEQRTAGGTMVANMKRALNEG
jgi:hypothetical protein